MVLRSKDMLSYKEPIVRNLKVNAMKKVAPTKISARNFELKNYMIDFADK